MCVGFDDGSGRRPMGPRSVRSSMTIIIIVLLHALVGRPRARSVYRSTARPRRG
jgi:hypothetical protein